MRKSAKRSLYSAYNHRRGRIQPFQSVAVYVYAPVGAHSYVSALAIHVFSTSNLCNRVVVDHTVDNSAGNHKTVFGLSETHKIRVVLRLRNYRYVDAQRLQKPRHYCVPERRMVDVCFAYDVDNIDLSVSNLTFGYR